MQKQPIRNKPSTFNSARRINFYAVFVALLAVLMPSITLAVGPQFVGDFESGVFNDVWHESRSSTGSTIEISNARARAGNYACHFSLERIDSASYRAELVPTGQRFYFGREYWLGFSILMENWEPDDKAYDIFFQVHGTNPNGQFNSNAFTFSDAISPPSIWKLHALQSGGCPPAKGGATGGTKVIWSQEPVQSGKWVDWVFHFNLSPNADGFTEIWRNGVSIYGRNGPNVPGQFAGTCDPIESPNDFHFLKIGIYKSDWKRRTSAVTRRDVWYDEVRIGDVTGGYDLGFAGVAPGGTIKPNIPSPPRNFNVR